jgi:NAD(P)-dependent dehydrogenase (short-subunit alcohol dehydrogenase family)
MDGISDDQFRKILDNNILSNHWLIQMVLPEMRARRDGAIVVISSIGGLKGSPTIGAYNISKAADFQLVRNYAVEIGVDNIRINAIAPGVVKTDFARALWENPELLARNEAAAPLRRIGEPDDIGGIAVFLASRAAAFITGQTIVADGGITIAS